MERPVATDPAGSLPQAIRRHEPRRLCLLCHEVHAFDSQLSGVGRAVARTPAADDLKPEVRGVHEASECRRAVVCRRTASLPVEPAAPALPVVDVMLYIWPLAMVTAMIERPAGALTCQLARVPAGTGVWPVRMLIPGGIFVPGGQYMRSLNPAGADPLKSHAPHVETVSTPEEATAAGAHHAAKLTIPTNNGRSRRTAVVGRRRRPRRSHSTAANRGEPRLSSLGEYARGLESR